MALPLLLGLAAAGLGAIGHSVAKETNKKAEALAIRARNLYDDAKLSLETAQKQAEGALTELASAKKCVLDGSMVRFLKAYDRVKHVELVRSSGVEEIDKFAIDSAGILQLQEMKDIYQDNFSSGAAGVATSLAISTIAGGSVLGAGLLSLGGLSAIAGPVMLFTAFSASTKADENLEKAQRMYAEAEEAAEKMKTSERLCEAISERSEMFNDLLENLNQLFAQCTVKLEGIISRRAGILDFTGKKKIPADKFTENDIKVIAVTRSLAGAIKSVIDTPILSDSGKLSKKGREKYEEVHEALPAFEKEVIAIGAGSISQSEAENVKHGADLAGSGGSDIARNILAAVVGCGAAWLVSAVTGVSDTMLKVLVFSLSAMLLINRDTLILPFRLLRAVYYSLMVLSSVMLFHTHCEAVTGIRFFWLCGIILCVLFGFGCVWCIEEGWRRRSSQAGELNPLFVRNVLLTLGSFSGIMACLSGGVVIYSLLSWLGLSATISLAVPEVLCILAAWGLWKIA